VLERSGVHDERRCGKVAERGHRHAR